MLKSAMKASNKFSRNWQKGAVAIIVALSLPVLIGMAGLALDLGKLYVTKTELQNAADACALAAAVELDGTDSQFAKAESVGIAVGELNKSFFQSGFVKFAAEDAVKFATSLNGSYLTKTAASGSGAPADYKFVQCSANRADVPNYLIPVLGVLGSTVASSSDIAAAAIASNRPGQTTCALPIGICSSAVTNSTPIGTWLEGTLSGGNGDGGSYKWVDFSAPNGGAKELAEILNGKSGQECNLDPISEDVEQMGAITSLNDDYNTRFGIEKGSAKGIPDFSGYSYYSTNWPSKFGAYSDFAAKRVSNNPFQGEADSGIKLVGNPTILTEEDLKDRGADRRVAVAPIIDCGLFGPGNPTVPVERYVCVFLLHPVAGKEPKPEESEDPKGPKEPKPEVPEEPEPTMYMEYLGEAKNAGPCNQSGLAGASNGIGPRVSALVQ